MKTQILLRLVMPLCMAALIGASSLYGSEPPPGFTSHGSPPGIGVYVFKQAMVSGLNGTVWIGSWTAFAPLARYSEQDGWHVYSSGNSLLPSDSVNALHRRDNRLYIGTQHGLAIYDSTWEIIGLQQGLPYRSVNCVITLGDSLIVGTNRGVSIRYNNLWVHYNTANSPLINDSVTALAVGHDKHLWIGTRAGISRYGNGTWQNWDEHNSALTGDHISALHWDSFNRLWIATLAHGVYLFTEGEITLFDQYFNVEIGKSARVANFTEGSHNEVYFATISDLDGIEPLIAIVKISESQVQLFQSGVRAPALVSYSPEHLWITSTIVRHLHSANLDECLMHDATTRIEVNNLSVDFTSRGGLGWDPYRGYGHFEAPKGSGLHSLFEASLWIGGLKNEVLHFSGERYHVEGKDFWPGPVSNDATAYQQRQEKWNRVWKISQQQIDYHLQHYSYTTYEMPEVISNWPAHGDTLLGEPWFVAPYMDRNSNGIYEPHLGDHPVIRGDEALFFIFNDHRFPNKCSEGPVLGVEIRGLAYGFNQPSDSALHNTLFINYQVLNRSGYDFTQTRLGLFADIDIGYHLDDYMGSDTTLHTFFGFNGDEVDGTGQPGQYGMHPPALGVVFLNKPLDALIHIGVLHEQDPPWWPPPTPPHFTDSYGFLGAYWEDNQPLVHGGLGHPFAGGGTERVKHLFPGNINNPGEWHELNPANAIAPDDRRKVGSIHIGEFNNNDRVCFDMAFVFARDYQGTNITSVNLMKERVNAVRTYYAANFADNCIDLISTYIPEIQPLEKSQFTVFPNPASSYVRINYTPQTYNALIQIFSIHGVLIDSRQLQRHGAEIFVGNLKPGIYVIRIQDGNHIKQQRLIKL